MKEKRKKKNYALLGFPARAHVFRLVFPPLSPGEQKIAQHNRKGQKKKKKCIKANERRRRLAVTSLGVGSEH